MAIRPEQLASHQALSGNGPEVQLTTAPQGVFLHTAFSYRSK